MIHRCAGCVLPSSVSQLSLILDIYACMSLYIHIYIYISLIALFSLSYLIYIVLLLSASSPELYDVEGVSR